MGHVYNNGLIFMWRVIFVVVSALSLITCASQKYDNGGNIAVLSGDGYKNPIIFLLTKSYSEDEIKNMDASSGGGIYFNDPYFIDKDTIKMLSINPVTIKYPGGNQQPNKEDLKSLKFRAAELKKYLSKYNITSYVEFDSEEYTCNITSDIDIDKLDKKYFCIFNIIPKNDTCTVVDRCMMKCFKSHANCLSYCHPISLTKEYPDCF